MMGIYVDCVILKRTGGILLYSKHFQLHSDLTGYNCSFLEMEIPVTDV